MQKVKEHILELSTHILLLEEHEKDTLEEEEDTPEHVKQKQANNKEKRTNRLIPGNNNTATISAIKDSSGRVHTAPEEIAETLVTHWDQVFKAKPIDSDLLTEWLQDQPQIFDNSLRWELLLSHVEDAIKYCKDSAPGPDGIPYSAFKNYKQHSALIIYRICSALISGQKPPEEMEFNYAHLICLPKAPIDKDPIKGDVYSGATTRPLSLVNTYNRIIAGAFRLAIDPGLFKVSQNFNKDLFMEGLCYRTCLLWMLLAILNIITTLTQQQQYPLILRLPFLASPRNFCGGCLGKQAFPHHGFMPSHFCMKTIANPSSLGEESIQASNAPVESDKDAHFHL